MGPLVDERRSVRKHILAVAANRRRGIGKGGSLLYGARLPPDACLLLLPGSRLPVLVRVAHVERALSELPLRVGLLVDVSLGLIPCRARRRRRVALRAAL